MWAVERRTSRTTQKSRCFPLTLIDDQTNIASLRYIAASSHTTTRNRFRTAHSLSIPCGSGSRRDGWDRTTELAQVVARALSIPAPGPQRASTNFQHTKLTETNRADGAGRATAAAARA